VDGYRKSRFQQLQQARPILEYAAGELGSNRQKGGLDFTVTQRRTSAEEDSGDWEEALRVPS
jgi:hypothetical protein